ncbi:MAG: AMP-binding protein [Pseudomonadota bacterium]
MVDDGVFSWHPDARLFAGAEVVSPKAAGGTGFLEIGVKETHSALAQIADAVQTERPFCACETHLPPDVSAPEGAFLTLSGGSSGAPKTMLRSQRSWTRTFEVNVALFELKPGRGVAVLGRISHSLALYGVLEGLHLGLRVHALDGLRPSTQRRLIADHEISMIYATPMQLRLLAKRAKPAALPGVSLILCGGGALDEGTRSAVRKLCPGADIRVFYGAAETSFITLSDAQTPAGSVGRAYPGVEIEVDAGEVWVRSRYLFDRYVSGAAGDTRWKDGFLSVGELGRMDAQGQLFITGRKGRMVSVADQLVSPEAVEAFVSKQLGGRACAVLSPLDAVRGRSLVLVLEGPRDDDLAAEMRRACKAALGAAATPRRVAFHPRLPLLASGKTDLAKLERWWEGGT